MQTQTVNAVASAILLATLAFASYAKWGGHHDSVAQPLPMVALNTVPAPVSSGQAATQKASEDVNQQIAKSFLAGNIIPRGARIDGNSASIAVGTSAAPCTISLAFQDLQGTADVGWRVANYTCGDKSSQP